MTTESALAWLDLNWPMVVVPVGAVIAAFVLVLLWRAARRHEADKLAVGVAVLLASAFSAEGMYQVATQRLHLPWWLSSGLFVVAEAAMLASAVRAHRLFEATKTATRPGTLGPHGRFVWVIAACAGVVVSLNAHSPSEYVLRLAMPLLVAGLWWMGYRTDQTRERAADAITLRWTPRRLGALLGIIEPGDRDLATVHAEHRIRQLTTHAHALHHGSRPLRGYHAARLRRLALLADDAMVAEVQRRVSRVHFVEVSTAPRAPELATGTSGGTGAEVAGGRWPELPAEVATGSSTGTGTGSSGRRRAEVPRRTSGTRDRNQRAPRRTPEETRALYAEMVATFPGETQTKTAERLGITDRALRSALNATERPVAAAMA
jgi:hypothetical protein